MKKIIILLTAIFIISCTENTQEFSMGQLEDLNEGFRFNLANLTDYEGDVVLWVQENEIRGCEHIFHMKPKERAKITIECSGFKTGGDFFIRKAKDQMDIALVAARIK